MSKLEAPDTSRLAGVDQIRDAIAAIRSRPLRAAATSLGVLIGVGAAVATLSLTATARFQVADTFNTLRATQVLVQAQVNLTGPPTPIDSSALERVDRLSGVRQAGRFSEVGIPALSIAASPEPDATTFDLPKVYAAAPSYLAAARADVDGVGITPFAVQTNAHVAVVGTRIAKALDLGGTNHRIYLEGVPFDVIGLIESAPGNPLLTTSVVIPISVPEQLWQAQPRDQILIHVAPGAASSVAKAAPYAIAPTNPEAFRALDPPNPSSFKQSVDSDLSALGLGVAGIVALIGIVAIASVTLAGVYERMEEFGLRRAIGARPVHLLRHIMTETTLIGLASGVAGGILGIIAVLVVSAVQNWIPVVNPIVVIIAPGGGILAGILAGIIPARRAAAIEPIDALRQ